MNKFEKAEFRSGLEKFADGRIDIHTFVKDYYQNDICDKAYEIFFDDFIQEFPENPLIKNFLDMGAKLYYLLYKLNKQLHRYNSYENYDELLICFISGRIVSKFSDNAQIKELGESAFAEYFSQHLQDYKESHNLIDTVFDYVSKEFQDKSILNIEKSESMVIIIVEENISTDKSFSKFLTYLIEDVRDLNHKQAAKKCKIAESHVSEILRGIDIPSKDILYRLILGLRLKESEYSQLIIYAKKLVEHTDDPNRFDIDEKKNEKDQIIMSFVRRNNYPLGEKNIIDIVTRQFDL